jgi:phosphatidylserine decarboxylase
MIRLHKEGYKIILLTLSILSILNFSLYYTLGQGLIIDTFLIISIVFAIFLLQFFRNPTRKVVALENEIIAPADGKIVVIEEVEETEFYKNKRLQVSIFMSPVNVHVNRYPISGEVKYAKYHPGKYLVAWHPKSSTENERTTVVVENKNISLLFRQIAGALARRIVMYSKVGDQAAKGEDYGFIKFGSRVDIFLPIGTKINVSLNQKVKGNETIIAKY